MQMREATPSALVPGNRNGANKSTARSTSSVTFRRARPGGSSDTIQLSHEPLRGLAGDAETVVPSAAPASSPPAVVSRVSLTCAAIAASMMLGYRKQTARLPQQDQRHEQNVRSQRQLWREEADIVARQSHQNGAYEAAANRTEPADDENDEHEDGHAVADLTADYGLVLRPHHAAHTGERRAGHEHADEYAPDVIAERLDHLAILDARAHHQSEAGARQKKMHRQRDRKTDAQREQPIGFDR